MKEKRTFAGIFGHYLWLVGLVGLIAWLAMLWLMFGDVL